MRLEQTENGCTAIYERLRATLYMRDEDLFIRHTIEAVHDLRRALGLGPMEREKAYRFASFLWKRYHRNGWQFTSPLLPMVGGILQGSRRKD